MIRTKSRAITEAQANILIAEMGVVAFSSLIVVAGSVRSWFKLKNKAVEVLEEVG